MANNIAPVRTTTEINTIINNARIALASLGVDIVNEEMQDITVTNNTLHRDKVYRLLLIDIYLGTILDKRGNILAFFLAPVNNTKFNQILDGLQKLANISGPSIPLLFQNPFTLQFFPSTAGQQQNGGMIFVSLFDASTNQFPTVGTLTPGVAKANVFICSVAGQVGGQNISPGEMIMALVDNPGQTLSNWYFLN